MVKQDIDEKKIGELKFMISNMMIPNKDMVRVRSKEYGGGSILEYILSLILNQLSILNHIKYIYIW